MIITIIIFMTQQVYTLYKKEKEFNEEELRQQGLTIMVCKECKTTNVLEDLYCRHCGEQLEVE